MIESGEKPEEYREMSDHWKSRICKGCKNVFCFSYGISKKECGKDITHVCFSYGYTKRRMTFEVEKIIIGRGNPEWGAPEDRNVFIIKLGKRIK